MQYKSVRLPIDFVDEVKVSAEKEFRSISQQLIYWASLGKELASSHLLDDDDDILGELAVKRYLAEKKKAIKVNLDEL